jgi:AAA domain
VVYTTGEGQTGLAKRIAAVATEFDSLTGSRFPTLRIMARLLDVQDTKDFIAAVKLQTADWAVPIRVMAFDTFNRAIVGGSESEGKDVARLLDADGRIKDAFACATLYAHHPGKAEGNDLRGHSSLMGDTDVNAVFCGASGTRTIEIRKQKDDEGGGVFGYSLRQIELGSHEKTGEIVTSCLVDWVDGEIARSVRSAGKPWPRGLTLLHDIITAAVLESGIDHRPDGNGPAVKAVPLEDIRALHKRQFLGSGDGDRTAAERQAFTRNIKRARDMRLIAGEAVGGREIIWTTTKQLLTVTGTA